MHKVEARKANLNIIKWTKFYLESDLIGSQDSELAY